MIERVRVINFTEVETPESLEYLYLFADSQGRIFGLARSDLLSQNNFVNPYTGEDITFSIPEKMLKIKR